MQTSNNITYQYYIRDSVTPFVKLPDKTIQLLLIGFYSFLNEF